MIRKVDSFCGGFMFSRVTDLGVKAHLKVGIMGRFGCTSSATLVCATCLLIALAIWPPSLVEDMRSECMDRVLVHRQVQRKTDRLPVLSFFILAH